MIEEKEHINVAFIGHSNTGKSITIGRLILENKQDDERHFARLTKEAEKLDKSSSKYAFIVDYLEIERKRGMTIKSSYRSLITSKKDFMVANVPGHRDYLKHMIAGTSQANAAVLMIDSTNGNYEKGISEEGQTIDHAVVAHALGVTRIIVAVNKMDDESVNYSQERFEEIKEEMTNKLIQIGFKNNQFTFVPISGFHGENLIEKSSNFRWWNGDTLLQALDSIKPPRCLIDRPFRFSVSDVYYVPSIGTVAVGFVYSGFAQRGTLIEFSPSGAQSYVRDIEINYKQVKIGAHHDFIGMNAYVSRSDIRRGYICGEKNRDPPKRCLNFTAPMEIMNHKGKICPGFEALLHCHNAYVQCVFRKILARIDISRSREEIKEPEWIHCGDIAYVIIEPLKPIVVESFRDYPGLGRFIITYKKKVIAIGIVKFVEKY